MCGNHTLECDCDYELCEKCDRIKLRGDKFCIHCLLEESRRLIKHVDEKYGKNHDVYHRIDKTDGTVEYPELKPTKDSKIALGKHDFPISNKSTEFPNG
jgi:hypothetical protein